MRRLLPFLLVAVLAAVAGRDLVRGADDGTASAAPGVARVVRVVDGDTIVVRLDGRKERVRYIGVDTPESVKPNSPVECFAKAASKENRRLVGGRAVTLTFDVEQRDRYGRLLAYVHRRGDELFVNAELVRRGFARTLTIPPNVRYAERVAALARAAREAGRGLWSACAR